MELLNDKLIAHRGNEQNPHVHKPLSNLLGLQNEGRKLCDKSASLRRIRFASNRVERLNLGFLRSPHIRSGPTDKRCKGHFEPGLRYQHGFRI